MKKCGVRPNQPEDFVGVQRLYLFLDNPDLLLTARMVGIFTALSQFLDQQVRAVWDDRMIKVRLKKGGAPEKVAKGLFGGLGEPPKEVKKENEEEIAGAFKFRHIPHETVEKLRKIDGVVEVQPEIWVMPRSMQVNGDDREFDAIVRPWIMAGSDMLAFGQEFSSEEANECVVVLTMHHNTMDI